MKRMVTLLLSVLLTFTLAIPALAGSLDSEIATATQFLQAKGILQGNESGDLQLEKPLTRAELAVIASRLTVNQEHLMADKSYYSGQCKFTDVPDGASYGRQVVLFRPVQVHRRTGLGQSIRWLLRFHVLCQRLQ